MAAPTFVNLNFQAGGGVQLTNTWPAHQVDDIALLVICSAGTIAPLTTPSGFVEGPDSPQSATGLNTAWFWCRATSTSMASVVTGTGDNNIISVLMTFRGCITTGNPWDVTSQSQKTTTSTATSITGDTTTVDECLIVYAAARASDFGANQYSSPADATLASITERLDNGTTTGNGGGIGMWSGVKSVAGAYGPMTATLANTSTELYVSIALRPPSAAATGTAAVTQEAQTSSASGTETLTATSAATQEPQAPTASGTVLNPATGTAAVTQDDQTSTASAVETITGTVAVTQANQTSTASGTETITGTVAETQDDQTAIATGVFGSAASGTVAVTQDDQTSTASGTVAQTFTGSAAVTQADQTSTATAVETFAGTSANVQADQVGAAAGTLGITGTSTTTQANQTATASGIAAVAVTGTVAVTQQDQFSTASAIGGTVTFWQPNPVAYVNAPVSHIKAPVAYVKVGADDIPPGW